ncbi:hypothetical protein [Streptomyces sp. NPDC056785]|uniref:hypothetical protein n=1 Tax=Streptomyces sp. NPDC056785 TaxID=3345944 RepID=UPI0036743592
MSENRATRVLEEGQNRAFEDGRIRASDPRPPLATPTPDSDDDSDSDSDDDDDSNDDFTEVPETGYGPASGPRHPG